VDESIMLIHKVTKLARMANAVGVIPMLLPCGHIRLQM